MSRRLGHSEFDSTLEVYQDYLRHDSGGWDSVSGVGLKGPTLVRLHVLIVASFILRHLIDRLLYCGDLLVSIYYLPAAYDEAMNSLILVL
jgi:hypothetical protein